MDRQFFSRHTIWTVFVSLLVALGLGACSDVSNVTPPPPPPSPESSLSSLTVSPGTFQPVFASSVTGYTVSVASSITSVTVSAQTQDPGATASINGGTASTNPIRAIPLGAPGSSTQVLIVVTAPNGSQSTYSMTVNRSGGSNDLQSLTVSPGALNPTFIASSTSYTVDVASAISSVTFTASLQDPLASMTVNGQATNSGQPRSINLNPAGSPTFVTIVVTAPNGNPKTYTVTVNRTAFASDNNLSALSVTGQTLAPVFDAGTQNYTVAVATGVTSVTVSATKSDPNATMSGAVSAGVGQATGQATITLNGPGSSTSILITVTAPSGNSKSYAITVNRAAPASDNNLSALSVTGQTLAPAFNAGTLNYTVAVATGVTSVTVAATKSDPSATMSGSLTAGAGTASTSAVIPLNGPGTSTVVSINVTAPNGSSKTYTITVNRAAAPSTNAGLSSLTVNAGTLSPAFVAPGVSGLPGYTVAVPNATTSITITAVKADPAATLLISPSATVNNLPVGNTLFTIQVTAEAGNSLTYYITVTRAS